MPTTCITTICSKNKQSLIKFLFFLINNTKTNFIIYKYFKREEKKKIISVLKSPHVNKKAQDQFEFKYYVSQFILLFYNSPKCLINLKKIKNLLFSDLEIRTTFVLTQGFLKTKIFDPRNYTLKNCNCEGNFKNKNYKLKIMRKVKNYLKIFDCYGELNLYKNFMFR
jgi:ribosomal protein S10